MRKDVRYVFAGCVLITASLVCLQAYWLKNFYVLNKNGFEREVNLAFEDAVKKEFIVRNDTIENILFLFLMDSTEIKITSKTNPKTRKMMYRIANAHDPKDAYSFSRKEFDFPLLSPNDTNKAKVAHIAAKLDREEDLDHHIIFYRTQNLGKYLQEKADLLRFDTARLRPLLIKELSKRNISEPFIFSLRDADNTLNSNPHTDSLSSKFSVITKAFPTYLNAKGSNFVRAYFLSSSSYLMARTTNVLVSSVILLIVIAFAFYYLIKMIQREKQLSAIKNDFINHITHEFKTPIATVYSAVQALDDFDMANNSLKAKKYLGISKVELERLSGLVTKVLNISLYERPDFEMKVETLNLDDIVKKIIALYQDVTETPLPITYRNHAHTAKVKGDFAHLYSSVNNLFDNAVKYSNEHGTIEIILSKQEKWLVLSIKDEGCGIAKEHQALIFDKFYRVPQTGFSRPKGFGLGLSYTKQVVEKHGGWCQVESEPGRGSIFTIALPSLNEN